jgi:ubiquitin-conjugating enzyme E2 G1
MSNLAIKRLTREYEIINKSNYCEFTVEISDTNILVWNVIVFGPQDTIYENGMFRAILTFPKEYPNKPPVMQFITKIIHPNIYKDGKVCISILHEGKDEYNYEQASERWNPSQGVSSILLSVISMLADPNDESPANIDAAKLYRENYNEFKKQVYQSVIESLN